MIMGERIQVAVYQEAKEGNYYCGDSFFYLESEQEFVCAIADGLGSGEFARESSDAVIDIIKNNMDAPIEKIVHLCNEKLMGKRGVVLGILKLDFQLKVYSFSSIGNIGIVTVGKDKKKRFNIPNAGYLAGYIRKFKVERKNLEEGMNFIMYSDGVTDAELSRPYFLGTDVEAIIDSYAYEKKNNRADDTTLIAMRYEGE